MHAYESEAWDIGEGIRQALKAQPRLRKSGQIQLALLAVIKQKTLGRGRESFFFSLSHVGAAQHAAEVARYLTDADVQGHALDALLKMKALGHTEAVKPLLHSRRTWIRNLAKKYLERHRCVA